eukprot:CAMPEP_0167791612 /NCGR_PEP_ID=MMETSP0111_2-20121227/12041_1 /TAXON_ID=91324 /ORGANISM="Lotharella globosa, Strain CCCM811" /LENGTH=88 /DNA_ID=CAMNT_0007684317 /DNA_START=302 /DNA_END=564 /DNA_ORIENTATION=+
MPCELRPWRSEFLHALHHDDAIASYDGHPDLVPLFLGHLLDGILEHDVHELVEAAEGSGDRPVAIQLDEELLVHVLGEVGSGFLRHGA